jgi:hypothetical protein
MTTLALSGFNASLEEEANPGNLTEGFIETNHLTPEKGHAYP